jgi:hypothetical protein
MGIGRFNLGRRKIGKREGGGESGLNQSFVYIQGGSNMTGTCAACLHTNQSRSYLNHLVHRLPPLTPNVLLLLLLLLFTAVEFSLSGSSPYTSNK